MSPQEFAAIQAGDLLVRRFDRSRWRVLKAVTAPRPDRGSQHMLGPLVELTVRRISPEVQRTVEPLTWDLAPINEEVG